MGLLKEHKEFLTAEAFLQPLTIVVEVRGQFVGSVFSFHFYLGFRTQIQVVRLTQQAPLPAELPC